MKKEAKLTVIESFCGAGGMSIGLKKAGFDVRLAFDLDEASIETYQKSIGPEGIVLDVRKTSGKDLLKLAELEKGELDLFTGGPPCQGFSLQRRRGYQTDKRNDLVFEYFRLVEELKPKAFLLENVVMLGKVRGEKILNEGFSKLIKSGYDIVTNIVNSANYGVPQTRKRFMAVGTRINGRFCFPNFTHTKPNWVSVREAIEDLPDAPKDFTNHPTIKNHLRCRITYKNEKMISYVPQGGGWRNIPKSFWLNCMKKWSEQSGGWPDVYGRLKWDEPCPTITTGFDSFSRGRYAHPKWNRAITAREAARLQTFPDNIIFCGTRHDVRKQIGNAVPPRLAQIIGNSIIRHITEVNSKKNFDYQTRGDLVLLQAKQHEFSF